MAVAHGSVADVTADVWDGLAGGAFYTGHAWSTYQERDADTSSWVVAVLDGSDVVAASTMHLVERERSAGYDMAALLGCGDRHVRLVLCGNRRGYDNGLLVAPGREDALALLVDAMASEAERAGADLAVWPYLDDAGVLALAPHLGDAEPWLLTLTAHFELPGSGFEDFLAALTRRQRSDVRRDRRRFAEAGRSSRIVRPGAESLHRVAELVTHVESKHGSTSEAATVRDLLAAQVEDVGDRALLVSCDAEPGLVACSLSFHSENELAVRVAGLDYAHVGDAGEYFETVFYRPVELAYELDVDRVSVGFGSLRTKRHRGAVLSPRWAMPLLGAADVGARAPGLHNVEVLTALETAEGVAREGCDSLLLRDLVSS